jgi:hypothetical protein
MIAKTLAVVAIATLLAQIGIIFYYFSLGCQRDADPFLTAM